MFQTIMRWWRRSPVAAGVSSFRPSVEPFESRDVPSSSPLVGAFSSGAVFTAYTNAKHQGALSAYTNAAGQFAVTAQADSQSQTFLAPASTTSFVLLGSQRAPSIIQNTTALPAVEVGGFRSDTIFTGNGGTVGSPADLALPGGGFDTIYSLVGVHTLVTSGDGRDRVITNPQNTLQVDPNDQVVTFFANGRTPGSGTVALVGGSLYISPTNNGSTTSIDHVRNTVVLTTDLGDGAGPQTFTYRKQDVRFIAFFGGTGADSLFQNTTIDTAAYGSAGNDFLYSRGRYTLEKGSGGNDVLYGAGRTNDLSANGGIDTLYALAGQGHSIFRTALNGSTTVIGQARGDVTVSP